MRFLKTILLCYLFPALLMAQSAYDPVKTFTPQQLQEDFSIMRRHLETMHAGLYSYTPKAKMDQRFASIEKQLNQPLTEIQFYQLVGPLLADIKDAHTSIYASGACLDYVDEKMKLLPLGVRWIGGQLFITRNFSRNEEVQQGDILKIVNGESALELFEEMLPYMQRDGNNLTSPRRDLSGRFMDFYGLFYGQPEVFEVELESANGENKKLKLMPETWTDQLKIWEERYGPRPSAPKEKLDLKIEGDIATMTVRSWHPGRIKRGGQNFKKFFKNAFQQIDESNVQHLILDMRDNGGGSEVVFMQLFGHLVDQPYTVYKELSSVTIEIPDHQYYPYDKVKQLEKYGKIAMEKRGDRYYIKDSKDASLRPAKPLAPHYKGKLYVLINERSHSATGDLSGVIRQHNRGLFIGTESGGNPYENVAGDAPFLHLPNTGVRVAIPILKYVINIDKKNPGRGIIPDHAVEPSIQDILQKKDVVMEFALDLIDKERR